MAESSDRYTQGLEWAGICTAVYNGVCFLFSLALLRLTRWLNRQVIHAASLSIGGLSLISLLFIHDPYGVLLPMVGLGIAWASILSIPYALLEEALPDRKMGIYMGLFNAFIITPQIVAALGLGWAIAHLLHSNRLLVVVLGGVSFLIAAFPDIRSIPLERNGRPRGRLLPDRRQPHALGESNGGGGRPSPGAAATSLGSLKQGLKARCGPDRVAAPRAH